jgi:hypothetical protein
VPLASTFIRELQRIEPRSIFEYFNKREGQGHHSRIELTNEVRPADLFCYLGARFGTPNGLQNLLRSDDSDNLFHWDWTLRHEAGLVQIVGMNFRTEITIFGLPPEDSHKSAVIEQIKADFPNHSAGMGNIRKGLEHWTEFVNPYQRVRRAVQRLMEMLDALELKPEISRMEPLGPEGPRRDGPVGRDRCELHEGVRSLLRNPLNATGHGGSVCEPSALYPVAARDQSRSEALGERISSANRCPNQEHGD